LAATLAFLLTGPVPDEVIEAVNRSSGMAGYGAT
jgi:hypothetical protein